jgi:hypothetical protein
MVISADAIPDRTPMQEDDVCRRGFCTRDARTSRRPKSLGLARAGQPVSHDARLFRLSRCPPIAARDRGATRPP